MSKHPSEILGNPHYRAISYGGYRENTRDVQPTIAQLKEDLKLLAAMKVRVLRDYNVQLPHAGNLLQAIRELKKEIPGFEMYVMLGAWIDCQYAWTDKEPNHEVESTQANANEIQRAIDLANEYSDIVRVIAVGNEAMVRWATSYFVRPNVILKWVRHLQDMKRSGDLAHDIWITSSDDFASWGGGDPSYHTEDLASLIREVDFVSMHTYPMHNSHYNPQFWKVPESEQHLSTLEKIDAAMNRSIDFVIQQYNGVHTHMKNLGVDKPLHIGESGWATVCSDDYGAHGSKAADEYKSGLYYQRLRKWTEENNISCFYFEAFDEPWKDQNNVNGSENHFGLIDLEGRVKYALWDLVDEGAFDGLTRGGYKITKSYDGDLDKLLTEVLAPPTHY